MTKKEIEISLTKNELHLKFWEKITHYGIVIGILIMNITLLFLKLSNSKAFTKFDFYFLTVSFFLSIIFYFIQKKRLRFRMIETNLDRLSILNIINEVEHELKWIRNSNRQKLYIATTSPSFFSGSWGELITIIFDDNKIYINSICNPFEKSSLISMGRNKKNVTVFINKIKKASH